VSRPAALAAGLAALLLAMPAQAVMPGETMDDPALEARARTLYGELRCVVCQNQSIDDSSSEIAADMRALIRQQLVAGAGDEQIRDAMVSRYGTYVLLDPPMSPLTYGLWFGPPALLVAGLAGIIVWRLRRGTAPDTEDRPLTAEERERVAALLGDGDREAKA
jgi:cytochrome c-type biogenesis protein CcmH